MAKEETTRDKPVKVVDDRKKDIEQKQKERVQRRKQREQKEIKRIHSIIEFPFKFLFKACLVVGLVFFIFKYFGQSQEIGNSLLIAFIIFSSAYIGIGAIMLLVLFIVSAAKKEKLREQIKAEKEQKQLEDQRRAEEEARFDNQYNSGGIRDENLYREPSVSSGFVQQKSASTGQTESDFVTQDILSEELDAE